MDPSRVLRDKLRERKYEAQWTCDDVYNIRSSFLNLKNDVLIGTRHQLECELYGAPTLKLAKEWINKHNSHIDQPNKSAIVRNLDESTEWSV